MKKIILAVLMGLSIISTSYAADEIPTRDPKTQAEGLNSWFNDAWTGGGPIAMPGYFWGYGATPSTFTPGAPSNDVGYSAKIEQGVDWFAFDDEKKWRFNTFINTYVTKNTSNYAYTYGNQLTPAVGAKIRNVYENGVIEVGVQYVQQYNLSVSGQSGHGAQAFASYWFGWDLKDLKK